MAQDAVDDIVASGRVGFAGSKKCVTVGMPLVGAAGYTHASFTEVAHNYLVPHRPGYINIRIAKHLADLFYPFAPFPFSLPIRTA